MANDSDAEDERHHDALPESERLAERDDAADLSESTAGSDAGAAMISAADEDSPSAQMLPRPR